MSLQLDTNGIRAVIFDLDGTLYNKKGLPLRLIAADPLHMFILGNERKARANLKGRWFGNEEAYYEALFASVAAMSHTTAQRAQQWYTQRYMPTMVRILQRHYAVEPWVGQLLADLRQQGIRTAVYSDYGHLRERLEALQFNPQWVDIIASAPALGGLKPCRQSTLALCQQLGVPPDATLMVGDRDDTDGESARQCGMRFHHVAL